jgi:hypothetical protein
MPSARIGEDGVAEGTGREGGVGLDQRHVNSGIPPAQKARAGGAGKAATHDDDPGNGLGARVPGQERQRECRRRETQESASRASRRRRATCGR